ncbi:MAG: DUF1573 domain-containing protein [Prevotella sp.]|nr:DUF1573 domain-containing protein [Prevotella sp.]
MNKKIRLCAMALSVWAALSVYGQHVGVRSDVINVGQVVFYQPVTAEYELKNNSGGMLHVRDVRTTCGCTAVEYPQQGIPSGEDFFIRITYDAKQMGHFEKSVGIYTDVETLPVVLTLKGVVVEEIKDFVGEYPYKLGDLLVDRDNIEFDDVNQGDRPVAKIHVKNETGGSSEPVVMHLPNYLKAEVSPSKIASGHSGVITIMLDTRQIRDYGLIQRSVYLGKFPGDKVASNKEIVVSAVMMPGFRDLTERELAMAPKIQLSTTSLELGRFGSKKKLKGDIEMVNIGKSELEIAKLQMFTTGLQLSLNKTRLAPGEGAKLKVTAVAKELRDVRSKPRVLMITNDPDHSKVVIDINVE